MSSGIDINGLIGLDLALLVAQCPTAYLDVVHRRNLALVIIQCGRTAVDAHRIGQDLTLLVIKAAAV